MALKFLNKKGWHTGSLRNIENVWKAEQKHDAEQKKLEELRKQIQEERERSEFRLLQEQAGLVPRQERLEFLYDSGLAVGKGSSDGFKTLDPVPSNDVASSSSGKQQGSVVPGALFEEKPQSANDAWRKLHSDPLLMIRQREQEALARIKNNPVQMARIRKSVEKKKPKEKEQDRKEEKKLHHKSSKHHKHSSSRHQSEERTPEEERKKSSSHKSSKHHKHSSSRHQSEERTPEEERKKSSSHKRSNYEDKTPRDSEDEVEWGRLKRMKHHKDMKHKERSNYYDKTQQDSEDESGREGPRDRRHHRDDLKYKERTSSGLHDLKSGENDNLDRIKHREKSKDDKSFPGERRNDVASRGEAGNRSFSQACYSNSPANQREPHYRRRNTAPKLTEEERAAKLREMQMDVEVHEEQRRKRIRKAEENDVREAAQAGTSRGRNFLDSTQKSVYGAEKGGSSTIEESVRRRTHYLQGRSEVEGNAFRR